MMEFHYLLLYVFVFLIFFIIPILSSKGITWNISATTNDGKKQILKNVVGYSKEGKLHAILGPSGSGKTTFLNSIAESIPYKSLKVYGTLSSTFPSNPIFVPQEDLLFAQLTVDETLITSSELKQLKTNSNHQTVISRVSSLILDLGLKKVKNTRVGNAKTRGISGGEKKRLSIGNELAGSSEDSRDIKKLIFCDEPTSGLDSFQAEKVMQLLKDITKNGSTVIASIHQPRSSIYTLFDEITLLSEGLVIYSGDATKMEQYFSSIGYPCPKHVNPAEYYIDLVSIDYSSPEIEKVCRERINNLSEAFIQSNVYYQTVQISNKIESTVKAIGDKHNQIKRFKPSLKTRLFNSIKTFRTLFIRAWRQVTRDKPLNIARLASNLFSGLLFGAIYYKLSNGANTVGDRLGLLQVAAINTAMTAVMKATTSFVTEKLIVQRERRTETYAVFPYFLSKLMAEVPLSAFFPCLFGVIMYKLCGLNPAPGRLLKFLSILTVESMASSAFGMAVGSVSSSVESAISVAPAAMTIFIVFGGLYVVNTPWYLSWIPNISLIRWAYEALCLNEFSELKFVPQAATGQLSVSSGEQVLASLGYKTGVNTIKRALSIEVAIVLTNYVLTYISLLVQKPRYEKIRPYDTTNNDEPSNLQTSDSVTVSTTTEEPLILNKESGKATNSKSNPIKKKVVMGHL